jgi:alkyl sulfatase BDS1-like metallo-beta-lactamase superfamily hydrolase
MGAYELRNGTIQFGRGGPPAMSSGMTGEQLVDMVASRFDPTKCALETLSIAWTVTDLDTADEPLTHRLTVENSAIHYDADVEEADVHVRLDRAAMVDVIAYPERFDGRIEDGTIVLVAGDLSVMTELLTSVDTFISANLVEP